MLGRPDVGLLGGAEMTDNARRMAQTVVGVGEAVAARTDVAQVEGTRAAIDRALRFADA